MKAEGEIRKRSDAFVSYFHLSPSALRLAFLAEDEGFELSSAPSARRFSGPRPYQLRVNPPL